MTETAMDGRPDVEVTASVKMPRNISDTNHEHFVLAEVRFAIECRFCDETEVTHDLLRAVSRAAEHVETNAHKINKAQYQDVPVAPPERPAMDTPWYKDEQPGMC